MWGKIMNTTNTTIYGTNLCNICLGEGYYRDYQGIWHKCPRCNADKIEVWNTIEPRIWTSKGKSPLCLLKMVKL